MKLIKLMSFIYNRFFSVLYPIKYAKKIGVNFPENELYLHGKVDWNTEPWIITLGRNVHLTNHVTFITHDGGTLIYRRFIPDLEITKPIIIGDNVYIGMNTTILPGVKVGNNVIVGACSVVTKDVPDNYVVAGNPAKFIKTTDEYLEKIKKESLHLGHLKGKEKDDALKKYYNFKKS